MAMATPQDSNGSQNEQPDNAQPEKQKSPISRGVAVFGKIGRYHTNQFKSAFNLRKLTRYDTLKQQKESLQNAVSQMKNESGETFDGWQDMVRKRGYTEQSLRKMYYRYSIYTWVFVASGMICAGVALWNVGKLLSAGISIPLVSAIFSQTIALFLMTVLALWYGFPAAQIRHRELFPFQQYIRLGFEMLPGFHLPSDWKINGRKNNHNPS